VPFTFIRCSLIIAFVLNDNDDTTIITDMFREPAAPNPKSPLPEPEEEIWNVFDYLAVKISSLCERIFVIF
jgi:hypothetical protein